MELDFSQMALEVSHHGYLLVTHLTTQEHCCHTSFHAYWYLNVMRSSRLFRVSLFLENGAILMIWGCFSMVSNVIRSNYCCTRHTMHGNMVFSRESIFPTPQQSGCLHACSENWSSEQKVFIIWTNQVQRMKDPSTAAVPRMKGHQMKGENRIFGKISGNRFIN